MGIEGDFGGEEGSRRKSRREQHEQERVRKEQQEQEKRQEQESRRKKQEQERKEKEEKEEQEKKERHSHERKGRKEKKGEGRGSFPLQYTRWQDQTLTMRPMDCLFQPIARTIDSSRPKSFEVVNTSLKQPKPLLF